MESTHIHWIDTAHKKPPQNTWLLWLTTLLQTEDDGRETYCPCGIQEGIYRFGRVKAIGGTFSLPGNKYRRVFWAEYDLPEGIER